MATSLLSRAISWLRRFLRRVRQRRLGPASRRPWTDQIAVLPEDLKPLVARVVTRKGVIFDTVGNALEDYADLMRIAATSSVDPIFDATVLANAQLRLRSILERAPTLEFVIESATRRISDQAGRQAVGEAILVLRDEARILALAASAALSFAANPTSASRVELETRAAALWPADDRPMPSPSAD